MGNTFLKIGGLTRNSVVNGPGIRTVLFLAGCSHEPKCKGCHNTQLWDPINSISLSIDEICQHLYDYIDGSVGLTISGGEPFDQCEELIELLKTLNACRNNGVRFNKKTKRDVWLYTGYNMEDILHSDIFIDLLPLLDVIIAGEFNNKYPPTEYMGSSNQEMWLTCNPEGTRWRRKQSKTYDNWFDPEYKTIDKI